MSAWDPGLDLAQDRVERGDQAQPVLLGEPRWDWPDQPPGQLMLGISPETGPGNEGNYFPAQDLS